MSTCPGLAPAIDLTKPTILLLRVIVIYPPAIGMLTSSQLHLLADHIKLSLLERQRAISLNTEPNTDDGHVSRSLDQLRDGIENIEVEVEKLQAAGNPSVL